MNTCIDCRKHITYRPGHGSEEVQALMIRCQPCAAKLVAGRAELAVLKHETARMSRLRQA